MPDAVRYERQGKVAVVTLDDGKVNALSPERVGQLQGALERAEQEAGALCLVGRPGRFSAGFDLGHMQSGPQAVRDLVGAGAELLVRLYTTPLPVVAACTGHALAAGALLLLASDTRLGTDADARIGLNEVAIGMPVPILARDLARDRLDPRWFTRSVLQGEVHDPHAAVVAGFLDRVVAADELLAAARDEAARLAELPAAAYARTKTAERAATAEHIRRTLVDDLAGFTQGISQR